MNYPIVIGNDAAGDKFGGLLGYPTSVLLSRDGKQVKRITGLITRDDIVKYDSSATLILSEHDRRKRFHEKSGRGV